MLGLLRPVPRVCASQKARNAGRKLVARPQEHRHALHGGYGRAELEARSTVSRLHHAVAGMPARAEWPAPSATLWQGRRR